MHVSASSPNLAGYGNGSMKRNVSFHRVEVRGYGVILSDNPSCRSGPALQLGWEYDEAVSIPVDKYEDDRDPVRRNKYQMLVPPVIREEMVRNGGHTTREIIHMQDEGRKIRESRIKHASQTPVQVKTAEILESTRRKFSRLTKRRSKNLVDEGRRFSDTDAMSIRKVVSMNDLGSSHPTSILKKTTPAVEKRQSQSEELQISSSSLSTEEPGLPIDHCATVQEDSELNDDGDGVFF